MKKRIGSWILTLALLCVCAAVLSGTARAAVTSALPSSGSVAAGTYTLTGNVTLTGELSINNGVVVTIDLNGHTLHSEDSNVISVNSGGTLRLLDSGSTSRYGKWDDATYSISENSADGTLFTGTGGVITGNHRGIYVAGTLIMEGGAIAGNKEGGVKVSDGGVFLMYGGTIAGNTNSSSGSGVQIDSRSDDGKFVMYDGTISDNRAATNYGGSVYVSGKGEFVLSGGSITGNTATRSDGNGGVATFGTFIMTGGTISGNTAGANAASYANVHVFDGGKFLCAL